MMSSHGWQDEGMTRRRYVRLVLMFGVLVALPPLSIDLYLPALPAIRDDFGTTDSMTQLTLTGMLVGMGMGQLVIGPISDAVGRRRPLVLGLLAHATVSLLCSLAWSIEALAALRFVQGLSASAVSVVVMATIRDRFQGTLMATIVSRNMIIVALAPILAPSLGSVLLEFTGWRGIFATLLMVAIVLAGLAVAFLEESLPPERRTSARPRAIVSSYLGLVRDPTFVGLAFIGGFTGAAIFSYIGSAPFVFQDGFGLSTKQFGAVLGINALLFLAGAQLNPVLIKRWPLIRVMKAGNVIALLGAIIALVLGVAEIGGVFGAFVPMGLLLASIGLVMPNTPALALHRHGGAAGAAAAVIGCLSATLGGLSAPVVGAIGTTTMVPLSLVMITVLMLAAMLLYLVGRDASLHTLGGRPAPVLVVPTTSQG
jgi:DHA1 family bicyclomycin/chloramphenicol resistance-like MFS transporter